MCFCLFNCLFKKKLFLVFLPLFKTQGFQRFTSLHEVPMIMLFFHTPPLLNNIDH